METQIEAGLLQVEVVSDSTVSYASYQNNVPLIREIAIKNEGLSYKNVSVHITTTPSFAEPQSILLGDLINNETKKLSLIDIKLKHDHLIRQTEAERGNIIVEVLSEDSRITSIQKEVELLAYDQWAGTRSLPELLAAFSLPNDPVIDNLIFDAAERLRGLNRGAIMNGYQSKNREDVWLQISALYNTIGEKNIHYCEPPASFGTDGQKIRTPERILTGGIATCLDTAMLMASAMEQAGLNPVILLEKGHAWVGCWLTNTTFPAAAFDDCSGVRKRVASGELVVFETTFLSQHPVQPLKTACDVGMKHLQREQEKYLT